MDPIRKATILTRLSDQAFKEIVACMESPENHGEYFYDVARLVASLLIYRLHSADAGLKAVGIFAGQLSEVLIELTEKIDNSPLMVELRECKSQEEADVVITKIRAKLAEKGVAPEDIGITDDDLRVDAVKFYDHNGGGRVH